MLPNLTRDIYFYSQFKPIKKHLMAAISEIPNPNIINTKHQQGSLFNAMTGLDPWDTRDHLFGSKCLKFMRMLCIYLSRSHKQQNK